MLTWTLRQVFKVDVFLFFPETQSGMVSLETTIIPACTWCVQWTSVNGTNEKQTPHHWNVSVELFDNSTAPPCGQASALHQKSNKLPNHQIFLALNKTLFLILAFISSYTIKQKLFSYPQRHSWWWGNRNRCGNPFSGYLCVLKWQTQKPSTADEQDLRVTRKKRIKQREKQNEITNVKAKWPQ